MVNIKTPYGEIMQDSNNEKLSFKNIAEAEEYLRSMGWSELFIASCSFPEAQ